MNHGQSMAVMLLAGERMGYKTGSVSIARDILEGKPVHVMFFATIESEAIQLHNTLRKQPELVDKANQHCADLIKEYGLDKKAERRSAPPVAGPSTPEMSVTVENGIATLPDGSVVNLLEIQSQLNAEFQESGEEEMMRACDELSRITLQHQGPHGDFFPGSYSNSEKLATGELFAEPSAAKVSITVENGIATLPDGSMVNLLEIQSRLNAEFQESGDEDMMQACDELSRITLQHQGPHGVFVPGSYSEPEKSVTIKTLAGVEMTLTPVPMTVLPSEVPEQWLRFIGLHIPGAMLDEETQEAIQAFMRENSTEALWDGHRNVTLAGGMLADCKPEAVLQVARRSMGRN